MVAYLSRLNLWTQEVYTVFLRLNTPGGCQCSRLRQNGMALYRFSLWYVTARLYCHRYWRMPAGGIGALLGDLLWNYVENFDAEAFLGAVRRWRYVEGRCIGFWHYLNFSFLLTHISYVKKKGIWNLIQTKRLIRRLCSDLCRNKFALYWKADAVFPFLIGRDFRSAGPVIAKTGYITLPAFDIRKVDWGF